MIEENFKALKRWTLPDSYSGAEWAEYFVFLGQHRDSDALSRSNFECGLDALGGESETVIVVRERHWAVGWIEWIAIHESDDGALEIAEEIMCGLSDYPVLNETHFYDLERTEAEQYWEDMSVRDRMDYCARADISIFSARRSYLPEDPRGYLLELLRD